MTGGIGSGKSEVAKIFASLGAFVIDADQLARSALAKGEDAYIAIAARWPQAIRPDGSIDREALAGIVFLEPSERQALNAIVHPIVRDLAAQRERESDADIIVHEIPLLFESGRETVYDATVLVVAPREHRIARVVARSGLSHDEVVRRMAAQIRPEEARKRATFVIENEATLERLRSEAARVFEALRNLPAPAQ